MRVLVAKLIVALGLCVLSAPGLAAAQDATPQDRIQTAAGALEGVRTVRYAGQTSVTPQATGEAVRYFTGSGEFQAPDRSHMVVEQPQMSETAETVTVGSRSWMKTVDGSAWVPLTATYAGPAPSSIAAQLREVAKYLVAPTVSDGDTDVVVSGQIDLAQAVTDDSQVPAMMGLQVVGNAEGVPVNSSTVTVTIDRATNYPTNLTTLLSVTPANAPEGLPQGQLTIVTTLTLSDFNSDSISIEGFGE